MYKTIIKIGLIIGISVGCAAGIANAKTMDYSMNKTCFNTHNKSIGYIQRCENDEVICYTWSSGGEGGLQCKFKTNL